ncbi:MAG TPA: PHB depolymerase family esterase [Armatimonadota bacterium]|jgi:hypothetical protein
MGLSRKRLFSLTNGVVTRVNIYQTIIPGCCLLLVLLTGVVCCAADWPPTLDSRYTVSRSLDERAIERYTHGVRETWGYSASAAGEWEYHAAQETGKFEQNHNSFYLVAPQKPRKNSPLCVVLHSANRTAYDYLGFQALGRKIERGDDPATVATRVPEDCYALFLSSTNAEWWGWSQLSRSQPAGNAATPVERRVLDTIEWVVTRCHIDRNRIYLCGVSMGGCGSLGLGLPHGDIFAAVRVIVPAGTEYAALRTSGFPPAPSPDATPVESEAWAKRIAGVGLPDPPVIVDFSAQNDGWSKTQPALLQAARAGHLPLVVGWGPFGHATFTAQIAKYPRCDVALAFPWLEIRKNEAYPVFTNATSDQRAPWLNAPTACDESGQINAYFRWKTQRDTPSRITMRLWLAHPVVKNPPLMPETSTADITFRRLQRFKVQSGADYDWQCVRDGQPVASGHITPDAANLLTIPQVTVTTIPAELSVRRR